MASHEVEEVQPETDTVISDDDSGSVEADTGENLDVELEPLTLDDAEDIIPLSEEELRQLLDNKDNQFIQNLFLALRLQFNDLTNEMASVEAYVVSADSLLLEILSLKYLNWTWKGQTLVVVYLFEKFLHSLQNVNGSFKLIWFNDLAVLYQKSKNTCLSLMYEVVKKHSLRHLDALIVDNVKSSKWNEYLKINQPPFVLLSLKMNAENDDSSETTESNSFVINWKPFRECFASVVYSTLKLDTSIVIFSGLQRTLASMGGFHAKAMSKNYFTQKQIEGRLWKIWLKNTEKTYPVPARLPPQVYENVEQFWYDVVKMAQEGLREEDLEQFREVIKIFILCLVLQKVLPLHIRTCDSGSNDGISNFSWVENVFVSKVVESCAHLLSISDVQFDILDMYDGKLFSALYCNFWRHVSNGNFNEVFSSNNHCFNQYAELCQKFQLPVENAVIFADEQIQSEPVPSAEIEEKLDLVPSKILNNELLKQYCQSSTVALIDNTNWFVDNKFTINDFLEKYHWHSGKLFEDDFKNKKPKYIMTEFQINRLKQRLRSWFHFYGNSLGEMTTIEKSVVRKSIPSKCSDDNNKEEQRKKEETLSADCKPKKPWSSKSKHVETSTEKLLKKIEADKMEKRAKEEKNELIKYKMQSSKQPDNAQNLHELEKLYTRFQTPENCAKVLLEQLELLEFIFACFLHSSAKIKREKSFDIVEKLKILLTRYEKVLDDKQKGYVRDVFKRFGFNYNMSADNYSISKKCSSSQEKDWFLEMDVFSYQLKYCGELLEVQTNPQIDGRVKFIPDSWQIDLLNVVDQNRSALIVAPTSAGKTFVSYYCIEKVLKGTEDGIVVYVSPTKALVNQVAATIYARFKSVRLKEGQATFGVFTRDYRIDVLTCRVLVTVPQALEILFLSPSHEQWKKKIKYAIFDEIHCIGGGIGDIKGSEVWEHIILMMQCPFLALSATVGNPITLLSWLKAAELSKMVGDKINKSLRKGKDCYDVKLVQCFERFSELELFIYDFSKHNIANFHPFSTLRLSIVQEFGLPADMQLTAQETYRLFQCMSKVDESIVCPVEFFADRQWLNREDMRRFERKLKEIFLDWAKNDLDKAQQVISNINKGKEGKFQIGGAENFTVSLLENDIVPLVNKLKEKNMLPCLAFSDNRGLCERLAEQICIDLETKKVKFLQREENVEKWNEYQRKMYVYEKSIKGQKKKTEQKKKQKKDENDDIPNGANEILPPMVPFDVKVLFSLCPPGKDMVVFEKIIERLRKRDGNTKSTHRFISFLEHGVGVHHSGLTLSQRQSVEILFRAGILRVVFSTSTLALGINMPCKSVVFCFDSIYLTPLQYRQMSGRAGRRGFDKKGNVIFYGLSSKKITKLLNSNLSNLKGNLPFSVSFVLQLLILTSTTNANAGDLQSVINKSLVCLQNALIVQSAKSAENLQKQLDCYFMFCVQILRQLKVINEQGHPVGLAGMISHLHYHEPGNFIFVYFLQKGLFHNLCEKYSGEELTEKILIILATVFTNHFLPNGWENGRKFSNSKVILEPMPEAFRKAMIDYNKNVEELFLNFVAVSCDKEKNVSAGQLPVSKLFVGSSTSAADEFWKIKNVLNVKSSTIQNPIAAISGVSDNIISILENPIVSLLDETLHFDHAFLPTKSYPLLDSQGKKLNLNAYVVDFYRHGIRTAICRDNCLFEGDVFNLLKDFLLTIAAVNTALEFLAEPDDPVVVAFNFIGHVYKKRFNKAFGITRD